MDLQNINTQIKEFIDQIFNRIDIYKWKKFDVDYSKTYPNQNSIIKGSINNDVPTSGIYAIHSSSELIYIGIGNDIAKRLISHYKDVRIVNKNYPRWSTFFSNYPIELKIYWKELKFSDDTSTNRKCLEVIEKVLHEKYQPVFESFNKYYDCEQAFEVDELEGVMKIVL